MHKFPTDNGNDPCRSDGGREADGPISAGSVDDSDDGDCHDGVGAESTDGPAEPDASGDTEASVDHRPDTNALYSASADGGRGTGPGTTVERGDRGLASAVGWADRDARGRTLSGEQRARANRLRKWNRRSRYQSSRERNLETGLTEVQRMTTALGLKQSVNKIACRLFRQATEQDLLHGRSIEGVASAATYLAARIVGFPRSYDEVETVSRVKRSRIVNCSKVLQNELDVAVEPVDPASYLPRICSTADIPEPVRRTADRIVSVAQEQDGRGQSVIGGASPTTVAAAAVFAAVQIHDDDTTQREVADAANVHVGSIRGRYPTLLDAYERHGD